MALFGTDTVICSLGISCQTQMQFDVHKDLIEELTGERMIYRTTPFDWLYSNPISAAWMLDNNRYFPSDETETSQHPQLFWNGHGIFYWHEQPEEMSFNEMSKKWKHISETFESIKDMKRRIFIISTVQNNLPGASPLLPERWYVIKRDGMLKLRESLENKFGQVELYLCAYPYRTNLSAGSSVFHFKTDDSKVRGDDAQWESVLRQILS